MPTIKFIQDAIVETANGREHIEKGTIQHDVSEATAARWERRGKAERIKSSIERAAPAPAAPPAPPSPDELAKQEADKRAGENDKGSGENDKPKTAATPYVPGIDIGEGDGKTELEAGKPFTPNAPAAPDTADKPASGVNKNQRGRPTGGKSDPLS